ncbi:hypothetical protein ABZ770_41195 [Streptomyces sp. NPDC006654]|uniref:hypothetical protein n=1 Tax=Streptomyces sp. NPDC006654 TaxID=3156897 RepID=UPI0033FF61F0
MPSVSDWFRFTLQRDMKDSPQRETAALTVENQGPYDSFRSRHAYAVRLLDRSENLTSGVIMNAISAEVEQVLVGEWKTFTDGIEEGGDILDCDVLNEGGSGSGTYT